MARLAAAYFALAMASSASLADSLDESISTLRTASPTQSSSDQLRNAWKRAESAGPEQIPVLLRGMNNSNPAVENWIRAAVDQIASRTLRSGGSLPKQELIDLVRNTDAGPRARRSAYELIELVAPNQASQLLAGLQDDPSLELRYDAIAAGIEAAATLEGDAAREAYKKLFASARDLQQIEQCKESLEALGEQIDLAKHLGFITDWRMIGVFDNTDKSGFDVAYAPESKIDFDAKYPGKDETAQWQAKPVSTDDQWGKVDLNDAVGPEKGAIVYVYAQAKVPNDLVAEVRYTSSNATKLWVNEQLVASNEVYHAGGEVDQYTSPVQLNAGVNSILLKVCQNEQTEPWAQDWGFQLRICDALGGGSEFETVITDEP